MQEFWWDKASYHSFEYNSPLDTGTGTQYVYTHTTGLSTAQSETEFWVIEPGHITGHYEAIIGTPEDAIRDLITDVKALGLPRGRENSLTRKLDDALSHLSRGNIIAAQRKLTDFINEVEAQRDKDILSEDADRLIAQAQWIIDNI